MVKKVKREKGLEYCKLGRRVKREDDSSVRRIPSKMPHWIIRRSTKVDLSDYGCTLKVYRRDVAKNLGLYGELHRFIPPLSKDVWGKAFLKLMWKHHPRVYGKSNMGWL